MRSWISLSRPTLILLIVWCCGVSLTAQDDGATRVWKDKTGKFRLEATLQGVSKEKATLRRADDGRLVEIPIASLSSEDVEFLKSHAPEEFSKPATKVTTARELDTTAARRRFAIDALAMYDRFLSDVTISATEKAQAAKSRERWAALAAAKKIRVTSKWFTLAEYRDVLKDEEIILRNAYDFRSITDFDTIVDKLKRASTTNPASIRADFLTGFLFAFVPRPAPDTKERYVRRSAADAEDCFDKCVRRLLDYENDLTAAERANLAACYNNLAITRVRQRKYMEALRSWQRCLEAAPPGDAVLHNIGQFDAIAGQSLRGDLGGIRLRLTPEEQTQLRRLLAIVRGMPTPYESIRGWRFMPLVPTDFESEIGAAASRADVGSMESAIRELVPTGGGTGFAVGKGLFVTNRHVADGGSAFKIRREGEDYTAARAATLVKASSDPKIDLALLRCDALDTPKFAVSASDPSLSSEIHTLGFPQFFELGINVKVGRGIIMSLPPLRGITKPEWEDFLMHDATTAPGSSGGPIFDSCGLVVGVHTGSMMDKFKVGVPASKLVPFLSPLVPDLQTKAHVDADARKWEDVVAIARQSTVHILCFGKPDRFSPVIESSQPQRQYDDRWCMACYGSGRLDCPERQCIQGLVKTIEWKTVVLPNGAVSKQGTPLRVNCPTCNGRGVIDCGYCSGGIDPRFSR